MGEQGHHLLKRLGKTKLRPGGITGSNWLFDQISVEGETKILEVACNEGDNLIGFAEKYGNRNYGVDLNPDWLEKGRTKVREKGLEDRIVLEVGDARNLPFEDNSFDVVINEAMLTMLNEKDKYLALKEYNRVLRPGGLLLTHDIRQVKEDKDQIRNLQSVLKVGANPLTLEKWQDLFSRATFKNMEYKSEKMTLLSERGMIIDEGEEGFRQIMERALKDENREQFMEMKNFFADEDVKNNMYYIVIKSEK